MTTPLRIRLQRWWRGRRRPSAEGNRAGLADRGEDLATVRIRDATASDIPALAELHAITWADTYPFVRRPPSAELRASQWRRRFSEGGGGWCCLLVESPDGALIGFAHGVFHPREGITGYAGELQHLYLRREYQRLGLGTRLMGAVVDRFLAAGVESIHLFADEGNPTCAVYEVWGGEHLRNDDGSVNHGNYGWKDLRLLAHRLGRGFAADRDPG